MVQCAGVLLRGHWLGWELLSTGLCSLSLSLKVGLLEVFGAKPLRRPITTGTSTPFLFASDPNNLLWFWTMSLKDPLGPLTSSQNPPRDLSNLPWTTLKSPKRAALNGSYGSYRRWLGMEFV